MTAQRSDTIRINDEGHILYSFPLEQYWEKEKNRPPLLSSNTSMYRGYYAIWLIEHNQLFLTDFYGEFLSRKEYSLIDLFPTSGDKIFANWFTGDLEIPIGKQVSYFHGGRGATYESSTIIKISKGRVVDSGLFVTE